QYTPHRPPARDQPALCARERRGGRALLRFLAELVERRERACSDACGSGAVPGTAFGQEPRTRESLARGGAAAHRAYGRGDPVRAALARALRTPGRPRESRSRAPVARASRQRAR